MSENEFIDMTFGQLVEGSFRPVRKVGSRAGRDAPDRCGSVL